MNIPDAPTRFTPEPGSCRCAANAGCHEGGSPFTVTAWPVVSRETVGTFAMDAMPRGLPALSLDALIPDALSLRAVVRAQST
ncbi:hypothetical protein GCM10022382_26710 [Microbacterium invictum]